MTPGNVDDRRPVPKLTKQLFGEQGLQLIMRLRKNMTHHLLPLWDKVLLRKRVVIESINDHLKNISQIEHSRHRSPTNFLVNLIGGLIAYCWQPIKPVMSREIRLGLAA